MTSFPLAATGTYAAVRPPEPPPVQAGPQGPPPMTSFPLAATGAYQAVGQQAGPDLSASGFRAVPGFEAGGQFSEAMGRPAPPGSIPAPAPPAADGGGRRRRVLLIGGSAVAVAGVAAAAVVFATGGGDKKPNPAPAPTTANSAHAADTGVTTGPGSQSSSPGTPSSPASSKPAEPAKPPVADVLFWHLNDKIGSKSAADASGKGHVGTLGNATGFSTAHGGSAEFNGPANNVKGGQIQTKGPAIDTTKSFTVSMWVDQTGFTTPTKYAAAFSQDGPQCFAFTLSYSLETKTWSFARANADGPSPAAISVGATAPTPLNTWVKLTGVYDAQAGTVALYVNGVPQGAPVKTNSAPYAATGPFAIGRSWYNKYPSNPFKGYISDVQVFGHALSADEVKAL